MAHGLRLRCLPAANCWKLHWALWEVKSGSGPSMFQFFKKKKNLQKHLIHACVFYDKPGNTCFLKPDADRWGRACPRNAGCCQLLILKPGRGRPGWRILTVPRKRASFPPCPGLRGAGATQETTAGAPRRVPLHRAVGPRSGLGLGGLRSPGFLSPAARAR